MRQNWKQIVLSVFFLVFISSFCPADETSAIHAMLDRMESAYQRHDSALLAEQLSENGFLFLGRAPDGVRAQSRQQMLDGVTRNWQSIASLRIESRQVDCRQDYAILYLTTVVRYQDGQTASQKGLALARKDPNDWKCCFAMERFFRPALLVVDLTEPVSAAKQAGVQKRDIILEIDGQMPMVSFPGDEQKFNGSNKPVVLTLLRQQKQVQVKLSAGQWGLSCQPQLVGEEPAQFVPDGQPHPAKNLVEEQIKGAITSDVDRLCRAINPEGFIEIFPVPGQRSVLITEKTARQYYLDSFESMRRQVDMSTAVYRNLCALVCGDVAVTSCRLEVRSRQEPEKVLGRPSNIEVFFQRQGQWCLAAALPIRVEIAGANTDEVHLSQFQTEQLEKKLSGTMCGIGVGIEKQPKGILIKNIMPGGSAEKAGLQIGQIIIGIDGQSAGPMTLEEAVTKIQGPDGSNVVIELENVDGSMEKKTLVRHSIAPLNVESKILQGTIGYIHIQGFTEQTPASVRKALDDFSQKNVNGLILDLRGPNSGLSSAVKKTAELFIERDKTLWFEQYDNKELKPVKSEGGTTTALPIVVLMDARTEAGELIAAALKRNRRAVVAGQNTGGKSAIRKLEKNQNGESVRKEIGKYFITPQRPISGIGVQVDRPLDLSLKEADILNLAIDILKNTMVEKK